MLMLRVIKNVFDYAIEKWRRLCYSIKHMLELLEFDQIH